MFYNKTCICVIGTTNLFSMPFTRHNWQTSSQLFWYPLYEFSMADTALADLLAKNPTVDKTHVNYIVEYMHRPMPTCCFYWVKPCYLVIKVHTHFCFILVQYWIRFLFLIFVAWNKDIQMLAAHNCHVFLLLFTGKICMWLSFGHHA